MLEQFREGTIGIDAAVRAETVPVAQAHGFTAFEMDHEIGETEAVIPHHKALGAEPIERRIDEFIGATGDLNVDNALGNADLNCSDTAAEAVCALELVERVAQVIEGGESLLRSRDFVGDGTQERIAEFEDASDGHT